MRATRAIIHLENVRFNVTNIRTHIGPKTKICVPVKADAYGHGAVEVSRAAMEAGADSLAVASVQEGVILREAGFCEEILLLSLPIPEELDVIVAHDIVPLVSDWEFVRLISDTGFKAGKRVGVHLKVDTGMGRIGVKPEEAVRFAQLIASVPYLKLAGICTHLSVSDSAAQDDISFTKRQISIFQDIVDSVISAGLDPGTVHAAPSGGVVGYPESYFDMVRPGILIYGYHPSRESPQPFPVKPVMEFVSQVVYIKTVEKGVPISYGRTYRTNEKTRIATLPVGYADGLPRLLSNRGEVMIEGRNYPIVGRICMDQCMVNIGSGEGIGLYDKAVIFGPEPGSPTAETVADIIGTIPYEVTCNINKRVPRAFVG